MLSNFKIFSINKMRTSLFKTMPILRRNSINLKMDCKICKSNLLLIWKNILHLAKIEWSLISLQGSSMMYHWIKATIQPVKLWFLQHKNKWALRILSMVIINQKGLCKRINSKYSQSNSLGLASSSTEINHQSHSSQEGNLSTKNLRAK